MLQKKQMQISPLTESDLEVPPKLEISTEESSKRPLKLGSLPISHTVCLFEDNLLLGKFLQKR